MRESMRWEQVQAAQQAEAERWQHVREAGLKGKQNKSSEHFDIITLRYHSTPEGQTLQYKASACGRRPQPPPTRSDAHRWCPLSALD